MGEILGGSTCPSPELLAALPAIPRASGARAFSPPSCPRTCIGSRGTSTRRGVDNRTCCTSSRSRRPVSEQYHGCSSWYHGCSRCCACVSACESQCPCRAIAGRAQGWGLGCQRHGYSARRAGFRAPGRTCWAAAAGAPATSLGGRCACVSACESACSCRLLVGLRLHMHAHTHAHVHAHAHAYAHTCTPDDTCSAAAAPRAAIAAARFSAAFFFR